MAVASLFTRKPHDQTTDGSKRIIALKRCINFKLSLSPEREQVSAPKLKQINSIF
jgi:hypothetical protein